MIRKIFFEIFLAIIFLIAPHTVLSQTFDWVKQIGSIGMNRGYAIKTDNVGNIYVTGSFNGTAVFDGINVKSKGERDIFIAKYSGSGILDWVKTAGADGYDEGSSLKIDSIRESVIVTGFMQNAQFEDTTLIGSPFFISDYDTSGHLNWVKPISTYGGGGETSTAVDTSDNIFVTGGSYGMAKLDSSVVYGPYFIVKLNNEGRVQWMKGIAATKNSLAIQPSDIACDNLNNVYVTGFIQTDTIRFDSSHSLIPQEGGNSFLVKYNKDGNVVWAIKSDNTESAASSSIAIDSHNSVYLTGNFKNNIKFSNIELDGNNSGSIFLVKYDSDGSPLWAVKSGGSGYSDGSGITVDKTGNIYITGVTSDASQFGDIYMLQGGIFAAKYNTDGKCLFATSAGATPADLQSWGRDIAVTDSNSIFLTGYISGDVHFGSLPISNNSWETIFITKLSISNPTEIKELSANVASYFLYQNYPNPFNPKTSISFNIPHPSFASLKVYDILGDVVTTLASGIMTAGLHTVTWDATNVASGVYFCCLRVGNYSQTKKLILQK